MTTVGADAAAGVLARTRHRSAGVALASSAASASVMGMLLALGPGGYSFHGLLDDHVLTNAVDSVQIGAVAALLVWLRPANRVGWLLLLCAGCEGLAMLSEGWALASFSVDLPGRVPVAWLGSWIWVPSLVLPATVLPAIYPTGRVTTPGGSRIARAGWGVVALAAVGIAGLDTTFDDTAPGHVLGANPISHGRAEPLFTSLVGAGGVCGIVLVLVTMVWTLRRLRYAASPEREQLAWLVLAVVPSVLAAAVAPPGVAFVVSLLGSVAIAAGIVRHQLFDIKLVLRRSLVYGLVVSLAAALYLVLVFLVARLTPSTTGPPLFAAAAVALLVVPGYQGLSRGVGRLVYGDRDDPVRALDRVGRRLAGGGTDLDALADGVASAVRSPCVEVRDARGVVVGRSGAGADGPAHEVALQDAGLRSGTLRVGWRTPVDPFSRSDLRLLEVLAAPVAVALRATGLSEELAESRARVLALRDTERRALRDDLHDGLGPALSGVALGIEAALKAGDEAARREVLRVVHDEVGRLVGEVRGIIEDLGTDHAVRGGLVAALRSHASTVRSLTGLDVRVDAVELPPLDPRVEGALHRIATEALTNVVRHAAARSATVSLTLADGHVRLHVADDGRGLGSAEAGVGRASMLERARAVGGTVAVGPGSEGGTWVTAQIPHRPGSLP